MVTSSVDMNSRLSVKAEIADCEARLVKMLSSSSCPAGELHRRVVHLKRQENILRQREERYHDGFSIVKVGTLGEVKGYLSDLGIRFHNRKVIQRLERADSYYIGGYRISREVVKDGMIRRVFNYVVSARTLKTE